MSISAAKKSVFGPATTSTEASAGTSFCCASTSFSTVKLSRAERRRDRAVAVAIRARRCRARRGPGRSRPCAACPGPTLIRPLVSSCSPSDGDALGPAVVLEHDGAELLRRCTGCARGGCLSASMYSTCHLLRGVPVLVEAVAEAREVVGPVEDLDADRLLQPLQDLARLIRQRELLGGRQVPPLVVPRREVVDARRGSRARRATLATASVPKRACRPENDARDLAPLAEHVEQRADEPGERQAEYHCCHSGRAKRIATRGEHERDAEPSEKSENSFQHDRYPRHRSLSTDLAVRNSPNVMKLR